LFVRGNDLDIPRSGPPLEPTFSTGSYENNDALIGTIERGWFAKTRSDRDDVRDPSASTWNASGFSARMRAIRKS